MQARCREFKSRSVHHFSTLIRKRALFRSHTSFTLSAHLKYRYASVRSMAKSVRASHILVNSESDANKLIARLEKGEKFEDLAKRFSKCPSGKKGGDLGWFRPGDMVPEFDQAAFSAEKGKVVGPIRTQFGYHLLVVTDQK
ncbi:MAG: peptidylprolyl isomerase [Candidatus Methanomethylophilaceae archaeon]